MPRQTRGRRLGPALAALALLALLLPLTSAPAGPFDAKVGEVRALWKKDGTVLRAEPAPMAAPTATLPYGTRVQVLEVRQPWLRVQAGAQAGWCKSGETTEPGALAPNAAPPVRGATGMSERDISAAGRQFDKATEQRYRASRQDLERAYLQVDAIEQATLALDPSDAVGFILGGALGRQGQDYDRPARLPATPKRRVSRRPSLSDAARAARGLGDILRRGGVDVPKVPDIPEEVLVGLEEAAGFVESMKQNFTPDQEYYLGRAVAANAIAKYGLDPDPRRRAYVRMVGEAIVRLSTRVPPNHGGYHFDVLNDDAINAVSGPGGFVLLTRGAVQACRTEDELAALICHELAHVTRHHAESILRQSKTWQNGLQSLVNITASATGWDENRYTGQLLQLFSQSVGEVVRTSSEHDYGQAFEFDADLEGTYLLMDVVYDHTKLKEMLLLVSQGGRGYGRSDTHAAPQVRAARLDPVLQRAGPFQGNERVQAARRERLDEALGRTGAPPR